MAKSREKVTKVIDGDTFKTPKRTVRLANVDAPETGTPGAAKATKELRNMIGGELVGVEPVARDTCGRTVAKVTVGRKSVNKAVREALATKPKPQPKASAPKPKPKASAPKPKPRASGSKRSRR